MAKLIMSYALDGHVTLNSPWNKEKNKNDTFESKLVLNLSISRRGSEVKGLPNVSPTYPGSHTPPTGGGVMLGTNCRSPVAKPWSRIVLEGEVPTCLRSGVYAPAPSLTGTKRFLEKFFTK